jgi:hypothetical protein
MSSMTPVNANVCSSSGAYERAEPWPPAPPPPPRPPQERDGVMLCTRPVDIDLGGAGWIADVLGVDKSHHWLKTDSVEYGMGPAPGARDEYGAPTVQVDQRGSHRDARAQCTPLPNIDADCVESFYNPGVETGSWAWPFNTCQTYVQDIVEQCRAEPNPEHSGAGHSL